MESQCPIPFTSWCLRAHKVHLLRQKRSHELHSLECDMSMHTSLVISTVWVTNQEKGPWKQLHAVLPRDNCPCSSESISLQSFLVVINGSKDMQKGQLHRMIHTCPSGRQWINTPNYHLIVMGDSKWFQSATNTNAMLSPCWARSLPSLCKTTCQDIPASTIIRTCVNNVHH